MQHNTVFLHAKHVIQSRARDLLVVMPESCVLVLVCSAYRNGVVRVFLPVV